jgi:hypothetical protein
MRIVGILLVGVALMAGALSFDSEPEPSGPLGLTQPDRSNIPRDKAAKVLKVLESANEHNDRLQELDEQMFGDSAH